VAPADDPHSHFTHRIGRSVSIEHAAQLLKVSSRTVYNRIADGRLRTVRTMNGSQRVLLESVFELHELLVRNGSRRVNGALSPFEPSSMTSNLPKAKAAAPAFRVVE